MTTPTTEAYLELIYMMAVEGQPVIGARLAESLHVSRPTVTITLKRMVREGLVKIIDRKEIHLSPKGKSIAEHLQRRHRVVERWLTDELGLDWAKSDAEAHHLEHAMSDEVAELLNKHLGYPTTCPHGNPIPGNARNPADADGNVTPLNQAAEGTRVVVSRVSEYAENVADLLDYLGARGIVPGAEVTVTEVAPLDGPLTLKLGERIISMSREVAAYVWVKHAQ
jgi:DtxR family transcriptional regulator, Mn-dependent transcriptional regulator